MSVGDGISEDADSSFVPSRKPVAATKSIQFMLLGSIALVFAVPVAARPSSLSRTYQNETHSGLRQAVLTRRWSNYLMTRTGPFPGAGRLSAV